MIKGLTRHWRTVLWSVGGLAIVLGAVTICIDRHIASLARLYCYDSTSLIPANKVGLLLGTSKFTKRGNENQHYRNRIDAAAGLFKAGKIEYILASGDNSRRSYDEPTQMKADLVAFGVPADRVVLDYAGFRTLDSIVRAQKIFGQQKITIISQRFHNERAIYLAQSQGIEAVGFDAPDATAFYGFKTKLREKFARVAAFLDLHLWSRQPKFLGEPVLIGN